MKIQPLFSWAVLCAVVRVVLHVEPDARLRDAEEGAERPRGALRNVRGHARGVERAVAHEAEPEAARGEALVGLHDLADRRGKVALEGRACRGGRGGSGAARGLRVPAGGASGRLKLVKSRRERVPGKATHGAGGCRARTERVVLAVLREAADARHLVEDAGVARVEGVDHAVLHRHVVAAKQLFFAVSGKAIDSSLIEHTCEVIAGIRVSAQGQEGLSAFLDKRKPHWLKD